MTVLWIALGFIVGFLFGMFAFAWLTWREERKSWNRDGEYGGRDW